MSYLPVIVNAGQLQQLPSGQALDVGGWTLPTSGGSENDVLMADASGDAVWSRVKDEDVDVGVIGSPTYTTVEDYINTAGGSGILSGMEVSDDTDGTITISAGTGLIHTTDSNVGPLVFFDIAADTTVSLTDNSMNYIFVEYNSGSPRYQATANIDDVSGTDEYIVGSVYKNGTHLHPADTGTHISSFPQDMYYYAFKHDGLEYSSGLVTSETGNRYLAITSGRMSFVLKFLTMSAFDSSGADTLSLFYYDGAWQQGSEISQLPNTQYNDYGTGLTSLTAQRYGVYWMYMETDGDVHGVYGTGNYLLAQAQAATPPASIPDHLATIGLLIAKIIFRNGDTNFTEILIPWTSHLGFSAATDHGALAGLSDDDHPQYVLYTGATATVDLGSQNLTTTGTVVGSNIPAPTVTTTMLVSTGAGAAAWATEISSFQIGYVIFQNNNEIDCNDGVNPATLSFVSNAQFSQKLFLTGEVHRSAVELASAGDGYLFNGHRYETFVDQTGTLKITIPLSWANMASTMKIIGYDRTTGGWELLISGYADNVTNAWLGTAADLIGSAPFNQVRLAYDGANVCILLGSTATSWDAPSIGVDKNLVAVASVLDLFDTWGMSFLSSESGITDIVNVPLERNTFGNTLSAPTVDDQVLVSTAADAASWVTAGNNQVLASDGSGAVAWANKPFGYNMASPASAGQLYRATGAGAASWTTDITGLTSLTVDNITIDAAIITSDTGAISFGDENLTTSGTVVGSNIPAPTVTSKVLTSTGADTATWQDPTGHVMPTAADQIYVGTGSGTAAWTTDLANLTSLEVDNITINGAVISSDTGAISFGDENLSTTGSLAIGIATASEMLTVKASASGVAGGISLESTENANEVVQLFQGGVTGNEGYGGLFVNHGATTKVKLNAVGESYFDGGALRVGTLTINSGSITDSSGAISFGNENLSTTGTLVGTNIPSPTVTAKILTSTGAGTATWQDAAAEADTLDSVADRGATTDQTLTAGGLNLSSNDPKLIFDDTAGGAQKDFSLRSAGALFVLQDETSSKDIGDFGSVSGGGFFRLFDTNGVPKVRLNTDSESYFDGGAVRVGTLTINSGSITDSSGAISFGNENLTSTGTVVGSNIPSPTVTAKVLTSTGSGTATWQDAAAEADTLDSVSDRGATTDQTLTAGGFITTGTVTVGTAADMVISVGSVTSVSGTISFGDDNLSTTGSLAVGVATASEMLTVKASAPGLAGGISLESTENTNEVVQLFQPGISDNEGYGGVYIRHGASVKIKLYALGESYFVGGAVRVGTLTIDSGSITDSSGAISFGNENLTTTSTVVGSNIPSPSALDKALVSTSSGVASWYTTCLADVLKVEVPSASGAERKFVLTASSGGKFAIESAPWPLTLTANETIYIRTTGNDTIGDGSSGSPFLTLERTIKYLGGLYIGDYTVTVDIGEGVFTEAGTLSFQHPFGSQVTFQGVSEQISSQDTASIGSTGTSLGYNNLYRYDVTFVLPVGKSVSVGDYIGVTAVSGGALPEALYGIHYVSGWVGGTRTATVQVVYRNGAPKASGTVTCTVDLVKTVVAFSNKNGVKISGPYHGGAWRGIVVQGNWNGSNNSDYGIWLLNGAVISLSNNVSGDAFGVVGFENLIYAQNNAMVFADYVYASKAGLGCIRAQNGGIVSVRWAQISGANNTGIYAFNGSTVAGSGVKIVGVGNNSVLSYQGSFVDVQNSFVVHNNATTALMADRWSGMDAVGSLYSDLVSPASPPGNEGSWVILT